jgi:pimeloyl-ACP methyl ester carboxylesterase
MMGTILAGAAVVVAAPAVGGLAWRRARQRRVAKALEITTPTGIVEQRFITVGGIDQWIQLRGEDRNNPVLLVLHGGPGWPNAVFTLPLRPWEQHFTVVQWDHRGTGKTLRRTGKAGSGEMSFDRRVTDAIEVIEFLRQHLGVDKVIVLAESMGTLTGLPLAKRRPDLVHALVATDLYVIPEGAGTVNPYDEDRPWCCVPFPLYRRAAVSPPTGSTVERPQRSEDERPWDR